jgi:hypothetical protein
MSLGPGLGTWDQIPVMERDPQPTVRDWHVPSNDSGKSRGQMAHCTNQRDSKPMPGACWLMSVFQPLAPKIPL